MFQQQALLKKSCYLKIPQLGRLTHHPRLDSFVHDVQKPPRECANRAFMPMSRFALSPPIDRKVFPKRPKKLGGARVPTHFHRFFNLVSKNGWVSFLSNGCQTCNRGACARKITSIYFGSCQFYRGCGISIETTRPISHINTKNYWK